LVSSQDVSSVFFAISILELILVVAHLILLLEDVIAVHRLLSFFKLFIHLLKVSLKFLLDFNEFVFFLVLTYVFKLLDGVVFLLHLRLVLSSTSGTHGHSLLELILLTVLVR
jgi:hypothetical protein